MLTSPAASVSVKFFSCSGVNTGSYQQGGGSQVGSTDDRVPLPPVGPLVWVTLMRDVDALAVSWLPLTPPTGPSPRVPPPPTAWAGPGARSVVTSTRGARARRI